jgi:hypothetical protein
MIVFSLLGVIVMDAGLTRIQQFYFFKKQAVLLEFGTGVSKALFDVSSWQGSL